MPCATGKPAAPPDRLPRLRHRHSQPPGGWAPPLRHGDASATGLASSHAYVAGRHIFARSGEQRSHCTPALQPPSSTATRRVGSTTAARGRRRRPSRCGKYADIAITKRGRGRGDSRGGVKLVGEGRGAEAGRDPGSDGRRRRRLAQTRGGSCYLPGEDRDVGG